MYVKRQLLFVKLVVKPTNLFQSEIVVGGWIYRMGFFVGIWVGVDDVIV